MTLTSPPDQLSPSPASDETSDAPTRGGLSPTISLVLLGLVVATGVVLRFWAPSPMWLDEAISVDIARLPVGDIGSALRQDGHPPLYYVLLHGWMAIFGTGDGAVRALTGLVSVATLPLMWAAGRRLGGRTTAVMALALLASSPFAVRYATEARMYALMTLMGLAGYLAVLRALERPRLVRLALVALLTTAMLLTHYWGAWLVATAVLLVGLAAWRRPEERSAPLRVVTALVVGGLPALAWLPSAAYQAARTGTPWARSVEPFDAAFDTLLDFGGGKWVGGRLLVPLLGGAVLLALLARPVGRWRLDVDLRTVPGVRPEVALFAGPLLLGLGAAVATASAFQPRYAAGILPFLLLAVAVGISRLPQPWIRRGVLAAVVLASLAGSVRSATEQRTQGGEVADALNGSARAVDVVAYCPDQLRPSVERELGAGARPEALTYPSGSPPGRIDWVDYTDRIDASDPATFVDEALAQVGDGGRVWLVYAEDYRGFGDDCEEIRRGFERELGPGDEVVTDKKASYEEHVLQRFEPR